MPGPPLFVGLPMGTAGCMHKEKIADRIAFEAGDVVMPASRGRIDVAEALVVIGFEVVVEIVQPNDLISAEDVEGVGGSGEWREESGEKGADEDSVASLCNGAASAARTGDRATDQSLHSPLSTQNVSFFPSNYCFHTIAMIGKQRQHR